MFFLPHGRSVILANIWKCFARNKTHAEPRRTLAQSRSVSAHPSSFLPSFHHSSPRTPHPPLRLHLLPATTSGWDLQEVRRFIFTFAALLSPFFLHVLHSTRPPCAERSMQEGRAAARPIVRCQGRSPLITLRTCVVKRLRQKSLVTTFPVDARSDVEALYCGPK